MRAVAADANQQTRDAVAVELLDLQQDVAEEKLVAFARPAAELVEHEPCKRSGVARVEVGAERLVEVVDRHRSRDANRVLVDAAEVLGRYGESVDLLIMGSHEYRPIDHLSPGSTAQRLAGHAPCPLLVLAPSG